MRILVADLDGTLLGGTAADRRRLHSSLDGHPEVTVVFATGRGLPSVREALRDPLLPRPRWIIADVGATVLDGENLAPVKAIQTRLRAGWPGEERVRAALRCFPALAYQHGAAQDGRCSYHLSPDHLTPEITDAVRALGCVCLYSADRYFDVLPPGASKGSALEALARTHDWPADSILVAGDSLNDLSLFQLGTHGVIVGNAEPALLASVRSDGRVHRPDRQGAGAILSALQALGWVERDYPLVVGYHRPPMRWTPEEGWQKPSSPNGILPTLHSLFSTYLPAVWVTSMVLDKEKDAAGLEGHGTGLPLSFLPISPEQWAGYFHRACKDTLWPVLMSQPHRMHFDAGAWANYRMVNERFAHRISDHAGEHATVWLHDYNLWLVPATLRALRPDLRVGLFHHTPFPRPDIFEALPTAPEIRASLTRLDWAGFHTATFAEHFRQALADKPGLPRIGVHPLGIDRTAIEALAQSRIRQLRPETTRLVLSIERLDYVKAPVQKVEAINTLLARRPELRGHLRFRFVCPPPEPGITAHEATRKDLERRIGEVNHAWADGGWQPVDYLPHPLSFPEVVDHYLAADVLWITSLQDGMNLTAKEFIAVQATVGGSGVLVLSSHTGAAEELGDAALLTDPHSPGDLTATLARALDLPPGERRKRLQVLSRRLGNNRPSDWASQIVTAIGTTPPTR